MTELFYLIGWNQSVAALLGIAVWLACRTKMLRSRPALCHGLWLLVLLKLVTPSLIPVPLLPGIAAADSNAAVEPNATIEANTAALPTITAVILPETNTFAPAGYADNATALAALQPKIDPSAAAPMNSARSPVGVDLAPVAPRVTWRTVLLALLAVSLLVTLGLWLAAIRQLRQVCRLLRGGSVSAGRATELLEDVCRRFGLQGTANLVIVDAPVTPMLWAAPGNSAIVLPRQLADSLADDPLRWIIAHELGHYVRRDHWTNLFAFLVTTLFWWNPIAWLARRELATAAEACCDAVALARLAGSRRSYAETLLTVVDFVSSAKPLRPALGIAFGESRSLRRRFEMLAAANVKSRLSRRNWALLAVAFVLFSAFPIAAQQKTELAKPAEKEATPAVASEPPAATPASEQLELPQDVKEDEIAGIVIDTQGKPLAGVLVDVWTWHPGHETTTDEKGAFRLEAGDGHGRKIEVRFSKPGYSPEYIVQQPVGESFLVTLGDKTYIEGTLHGPDGKPVAGAQIKGLQGPKRGDGVMITEVTTLTTSDADGHYRMYVFPDTYEMRVAVPGTGVARVSDVVVAADQAKSLDIDLKPGVRFEAKVVDAATREPVEKVVLWNWRDRSVLGFSDAEGKIVIDGMLPGKYDFNVGQGEPEDHQGMAIYQPGTLGRWWSPDAVTQWERKEIKPDGWQRNFDGLSFNLSIDMRPVTVETEQGVTFSGHVYDPDGQPVAGATVAPAKTGSGNSLTGDTRYSVKTDKDGGYRVVMPAGNKFAYNLIVHDGDYSEWRHWANGVSEPLKTKPDQKFEDFDLTLTRPATVRGRVVADGQGAIGRREVRASAADLRENRYYDPTVKVADDGSFELKFIRPGKQHIQVSPFWLRAAENPEGTSVTVDLKEGEVLEGIELRLPPDDSLPGVGEAKLRFTLEASPPAGDGKAKAKAPAKAAAAPADPKPKASNDRQKYYVAGRVFEKESGQPIADAQIRIFVDGEQEPDKRLLIGSSDATGHYRVEVPLGSCRLWFPRFKPGYWLEPDASKTALTTSPDQPVATHDIAVLRGVAWPVQLVVEGGGLDLAKVSISASEVDDDATRAAWLRGESVSFMKANNDWHFTLAADGSGGFTQCGASGKFVIIIGDESVQQMMTEMIVEPGFDIKSVKTIAPVPGTDKVAMIDTAGAKATIGKAKVTLQDGLPLLSFHVERRLSTPAQTQKFAGRTVDADGKPIEGVRIGLVVGRIGGGGGDTGKFETTDKQGRFVVKEMIEASDDGYLELVITKDGYAAFDSPHIRLPKKAGPSVDLGDFSLQPGLSLPIRVVDENDKPLAGAVVEPGNAYALRRQAIRTDAEGRGVLRNLPSGVLHVSASYGDKPRRTELTVSSRAEKNLETTIRLGTQVTPPVAKANAPEPAPLAVGQMAPEWSLTGWSDGKQRKLSDYRGKIVVLDFWATSCSSCVAAIPAMQQLADKYDKQGVVFLAIHSADGDIDQIKKLQELRGWTTPSAIDRRAGTSSGETIERYHIRGLSTIMVVGPDGKIGFSSDMPQDQKAMLARMQTLAESLEIPWPPEKWGEGEEAVKQSNKLIYAVYSSEIDKALAWILPTVNQVR